MKAAGVRGLVCFDLDGTLLRGRTACQVLAAPLGRSEEMLSFEGLTGREEIAAARAAMASWYRACSREELLGPLAGAELAPGTEEGVARLREHGVEVAIASITWELAVAWFADRLKVAHYLGTGLSAEGEISHVWGRDKARWLDSLARALHVSPDRVAAVGDSDGDAEMLRSAHLRFFVGEDLPRDLPGVHHLPGADVAEVADRILSEWAADG